MTVTVRDVAEAYVLAEVMPGAPELAPEHLKALAEVFTREEITRDELKEALLDFTSGRVKDQRGAAVQFWPNPPAVIERVLKNRQAAYKARQQAQLDARFQEGQERRALPAPETGPRNTGWGPDGPPKEGPPIDPTPIRDQSRIGSTVYVTNDQGEGVPDAFWPYLPGRYAPNRRKMLYDARLWCWRKASERDPAKARAIRSVLGDIGAIPKTTGAHSARR